MLENYFPVLLFILVGLAIGVGPMVMGWILAPSRPDAEKLSPYECGFEEIGAFGYWAMVIFLAILVVGFVYEWMKGALEWE